MRSSSEIRWIRAKNNVGQRTVTTDWHAIIPGIGSMDTPPGTVCSTLLTGSIQSASDTAVDTLDGRKHGACADIVMDWLAGLDSSPGRFEPADEPVVRAAPGPSDVDGGR